MPALSITPADVVLVNGSTSELTTATGTTITAGDILTVDSNGNAVLASNTTQDLSGGGSPPKTIYLALNNSSPGQPVSVALPGSIIDLNIAPISSSIFFLGGPGEILPSDEIAEDDWMTYLGHGNASDFFVFSPKVYNLQRVSSGSLA